MSRFILNDSYRADCFLRLLQAAESLLEDELHNRLELEHVNSTDAGWLSSCADVALVLGITAEQWAQAYADNKAYYENAKIVLK